MKKYVFAIHALTAVLLGAGFAQAQTSILPPGDGTETNPYRVSELGHLVWIGQNTEFLYGSDNFSLQNDIDASDTTNWNSGAGFAPIGTTYATRFLGTFNGNGKAIRNLVINRPGQAMTGFFGWVGEGAVIMNLGLEGGLVSGDDFTGALIGYLANGAVSNCHASALVSGDRVGGLVGGCNAGILAHCRATGAVTGGYEAGGLLGENGAGSVLACSATGPVSGWDYVGGLVGYNNGPVLHSFATGGAEGDAYVGGIVGLNGDNGVLDGCFSAGSVTGTIHVGGFLGHNDFTVSNSYWDTTASGLDTSAGGSGCVGLPTAQMMQQASYEGWDFTNVWTISEGAGYPELIMPTVTRIIGVSGLLAFGNVVTGQTATSALTITNSGSVLLTVTNITYPAGFSGAWSGTVEAGRAAHVTVTFRPTAVQSYGGTVTVNSDKTAGVNTIGVTGAGVPAPKPGQLCFSASTYVAQEGIKRKILVKRMNGSSGTVSVQCVTKAKSALAGKDYTSASYTLTWTDGQTASKAIKIPIKADGKVEGNEVFQVLLKNPVGATLKAPFKANITILGNSKGE
jgi:hypothetical protein